MIIQTLNIVSGFVLSAPKIKSFAGGGAEHVAKAESALSMYRGMIGIASVVLGVLALVERLGIFYFGMRIGSSFPQAFAAIATGLLLAPHLFVKYPAIDAFIKKISPHGEWIGILAILVGLGSLLFGCVPPICYSLRMF